jgi:hypothetical protein
MILEVVYIIIIIVEGKIKRKTLTYIHFETNTFFGIIFETNHFIVKGHSF